jgi:hypothetical protein
MSPDAEVAGVKLVSTASTIRFRSWRPHQRGRIGGDTSLPQVQLTYC